MIKNPHLVKPYIALGGGVGGREQAGHTLELKQKRIIFSIILKTAGGERVMKQWSTVN